MPAPQEPRAPTTRFQAQVRGSTLPGESGATAGLTFMLLTLQTTQSDRSQLRIDRNRLRPSISKPRSASSKPLSRFPSFDSPHRSLFPDFQASIRLIEASFPISNLRFASSKPLSRFPSFDPPHRSLRIRRMNTFGT